VKGNTSHTLHSLHSYARDMQRVPRSQTRIRVAIPRVNPGSEPGERGGLLSSLGRFVIRIRILMYPACILKDTRSILMYPDVSQTYLTCSVTFEENTFACILTCIQRSHRYIWDTCQIHQDTCILRASLVSPWIHVRIHQDTCILDCSSRYMYIRIHRDKNHDTCILDGIHAEYNPKCIPRMYPERHVSEMQDTYKIHSGCMYLQR
jgi:hypothetical protein